MDETNSGKREKKVAILDGVCTVLFIVVIFYMVCPSTFTKRNGDERPVVSDYYYPPGSYEAYFGQVEVTSAKNEKNEVNYGKLSLLVTTAVLGLVSVLAAVTLFMSTHPKNSRERKLQMTRYWMHCNLFTMAGIGYGYPVLVFAVASSPVITYIPILVYMVFRIVVTFIIRNTLISLRPPPSSTLAAIVLEQRETLRNWTGPVRHSKFGTMAVLPPTLAPTVLPLGPYRGGGVSVPSCQCIAPQMV